MSAFEERRPNADQQAVINDLEHNIILYASAGTGKTFTVARRVHHIIEAGKAKPEEILCLTFTIKAAGEMKDDILQYAGADGSKALVSTIHSFAYQILREESASHPELYCQPCVCDETDSAQELKDCLLALGIPSNASILRNENALTHFMSVMKHRRELCQKYSEDEEKDFQDLYHRIREEERALFQKMTVFYDPASRRETSDTHFLNLMDSRAGTLLHMYNDRLRQSNLLDFDDLICQTHQLFRSTDAGERWRSRFRYIIIDEMQDTTELEYDTLQHLFSGNNVMMCGDYFQTIYEWRGSNPEKILTRFTEQCHAVPFMFSRNYRSTKTLTSASFGYLQNMYPQLIGQYCPATINIESPEQGEKILNVRLKNTEEEATWIYNYLEKHHHADPTRQCIMARANSYIAELYKTLARISHARADGNELRFFTVDNDSKFFRKAIIKDILAFLNILMNPTDTLSLSRIARKYIRGVGRQTIEEINSNSSLGISLCSFIDEKLYRDNDPYAALIRALDMDNIVIYDTETTGLDLSKDQIIQISAIRLNRHGEILDTLNQMVIPTCEIIAGAFETHHQTRADIIAKGGIDVHAALKAFSEFVKGSVIVGHNSLRFDAPLVRRQLRECNLPALDILAEYDTMVIAKQLYPKSVNYKLATLCEMFRVINQAAHDALGDITATGEVLIHMLREKLIPQTAQRRIILSRYQPKFIRFHRFYRELQTLCLEQGDILQTIQIIISRCRLSEFYPEGTNRQAVEDLLYAFENADSNTDAESFLREFLSEAALSGSQIDLLIKKLHKIPIITIHQSKGCEFDTVILAGADDDHFPSYNAQIHGEIEEEKRVFYVAISRAKKNLVLTSATQKVNRGGIWPVRQSRFIDAIPPEHIETFTPR